MYVKNIDDDVDDDALREHFSQCGNIISAKVMCDDKGISKGFGFVCYSKPEEASRAVNTLHGNFVPSAVLLKIDVSSIILQLQRFMFHMDFLQDPCSSRSPYMLQLRKGKRIGKHSCSFSLLSVW